ncbi:MAG TPA: UrcA family protein [Sphingomonadaceae bacterium]|nr:UrcA family protein [Sphingomonadaceae bacterium]
MRKTAIILAAIGAICAAQPAFAEAASVSFKDLDLTTEAGREELDRRINSAAREVCGFNDERTGSRIVSRDSRKCYEDARQKLSNHIASLTNKKTAGS